MSMVLVGEIATAVLAVLALVSVFVIELQISENRQRYGHRSSRPTQEWHNNNESFSTAPPRFSETNPENQFRRRHIRDTSRFDERYNNNEHGSRVVTHRQEPPIETFESCTYRKENVQVAECSVEFYCDHSRNHGVYPIRHCSPKAHVLILNNHKGFKGRPQQDRHGAERDVRLMKQLWEGFQCNVFVWENQTAEHMKSILEQFSGNNFHQSCDFCVVIIMSHGGMVDGQDVVYGIDDKNIPTEDIVKLFHNSTDRPHLKGKPKLIFFQSCRGGSAPPGVPREVVADSTSPIGFPPNNPAVPATVPEASDILVAYPTVKGNVAFRHPATGSWFINAIATVFSKRARTEHVVDMLTEVQALVSNETITTGQYLGCQVSTEFQSRLRKKLYLFPGFPL